DAGEDEAATPGSGDQLKQDAQDNKQQKEIARISDDPEDLGSPEEIHEMCRESVEPFHPAAVVVGAGELLGPAIARPLREGQYATFAVILGFETQPGKRGVGRSLIPRVV